MLLSAKETIRYWEPEYHEKQDPKAMACWVQTLSRGIIYIVTVYDDDCDD
jgi:hypothetical protein